MREHDRRIVGTPTSNQINVGIPSWVRFEKCGHVVWLVDYRHHGPLTHVQLGRRCPECDVRSHAVQTTNPVKRCTRCRKTRLSMYNPSTICNDCGSL